MPAIDQFASSTPTSIGPLVGAFAITPSDASELSIVTRQIYAAVGGNIAVVWADGSQTVEPITAGERVDWRVKQVKATGTTATGLRGYY